MHQMSAAMLHVRNRFTQFLGNRLQHLELFEPTNQLIMPMFWFCTTSSRPQKSTVWIHISYSSSTLLFCSS